MNAAYFLLPKGRAAYLYEDYTFRQGLEKMHRRGYSAIPVITRQGQYVGTVTEGDFLWRVVNPDTPYEAVSLYDLEHLNVRDILKEGTFPAVRITVTMEELLMFAMNQNFIPVVDDMENFIGIVTRQDILRYFARERSGLGDTALKNEAAMNMEAPLRKIV